MREAIMQLAKLAGATSIKREPLVKDLLLEAHAGRTDIRQRGDISFMLPGSYKKKLIDVTIVNPAADSHRNTGQNLQAVADKAEEGKKMVYDKFMIDWARVASFTLWPI
jgi:hypothetical protein